MRRTAVIATAFLLLVAIWETARAQPASDILAIGTPVVFVSDGTLGPGAREGTVVPVHLRDALMLGTMVVAAAGTKAELILGSLESPDHKQHRIVALRNFNTVAGLLPVTADSVPFPTVPGTVLNAVTRAQVVRVGERLSIRTPFPFRLSNDLPTSAYTPTPARTAPPFNAGGGRRRGPSPHPTPTASPTAAPSSSPSETPSAAPTAAAPTAAASSAPPGT
ncbi:MAG TPA: hypothetical protein VMD91_13790 [Candidatus Sulfotelmatobacter sp.]|nr:hypothetical protein [Candidatus Sulfotelmatobacter sp.]